MRLLVTRPQPDADSTAARLTALGHRPLVEPLLTIAFAPPPPTGNVSPSALVFTSGNAVRAVERWPAAESWRGLPAFAVGAETARRARLAGFVDVRAGDGDAESLVRLVVDSLDPTAAAILHPAPRHRAVDLAAAFAAADVAIVEIEAYHAVAREAFSPEAAAALGQGHIDGVVLFSRRTAEIFLRLAEAADLEPTLVETVFYVMSERVGEPLRRLGNAGVIVAPAPDLETMLATIGPGDLPAQPPDHQFGV